MKNMRKLLAVALLIFMLGLPSYGDGQMETTKPAAGSPATSSQTPQPTPTPEVGGDGEKSGNGQMETTLTVTLGLIESILALI